MSMLSNKELKDYKNNGYVAPIDVLSLEEAETIRKEIVYVPLPTDDEALLKKGPFNAPNYEKDKKK